ncbi:Protein kinase, putative [Hondaea fermentalgiana]|uniref:cGMP-dependent protein kinase n=1 Tax=Hondaea fermentalgiana TaxID=2315210 RepID=A0A2R5G1M2_9STRA|nr:Protein kinase, putative [Hondaea fermentalgiana]|eukprot:GBG24910.1 Protein kinase, putative [Hondaea fermentalgiana]
MAAPGGAEAEALRAELRALTVEDDARVDLRESEVEACLRALERVHQDEVEHEEKASGTCRGEVFAQGDRGDAAFFLTSGSVRLRRIRMARQPSLVLDEDIQDGDEGENGDTAAAAAAAAAAAIADVNGPGDLNEEVLESHDAGHFGTHALVCTCPRTWTLEVIAPNTRLWRLSRRAFEEARSLPFSCAELIARHPVFESLSVEERSDLEAASECIQASKGQVLMRHGEIATKLFLVRDGEVWAVLRDGGVSSLVHLKQHGEVLWSRTRGEYFGEDASCVRGLRRCSTDVVVAQDDTVVFAIPYKNLESLHGLRESLRHHFFVQTLLTLHPYSNLPAHIVEYQVAAAAFTVYFEHHEILAIDDFIARLLTDANLGHDVCFVVLQGALEVSARESNGTKVIGCLNTGQSFPLQRLRNGEGITVSLAAETCLLVAPDATMYNAVTAPTESLSLEHAADQIYPATQGLPSSQQKEHHQHRLFHDQQHNHLPQHVFKLRKRPRYVRQHSEESARDHSTVISLDADFAPERHRSPSTDTTATFAVEVVTDEEGESDVLPSTSASEHTFKEKLAFVGSGKRQPQSDRHHFMASTWPSPHCIETTEPGNEDQHQEMMSDSDEDTEPGHKRRRPRLQSVPVTACNCEPGASPNSVGISEAFGAWRGPMESPKASPQACSPTRRSSLHARQRRLFASSMTRAASVPIVPFLSADGKSAGGGKNDNERSLGTDCANLSPNKLPRKTLKTRKQLAFLSGLAPLETSITSSLESTESILTSKTMPSPHRNGTPTSRTYCKAHRGSEASTRPAKPRTPGQAHENPNKATSPKKRATGLVLSLDSLERLQNLGAGAFGSVSLVRDRETNHIFALKQLSKRKIIARRQEQRVQAERAIMAKVGGQNPFIAGFVRSFQDDRSVYLLLECGLGGDLFDLIESRPSQSLTVKEMQFFSGQIALAIEYLHFKRIVFRDIKPENCILCVDGYLRLTDFGMAKELGVGTSRTYTLCGTPTFIAPEVLTLQGYSTSIDWWALGVFYYELMTGSFPFPAQMVSSLRAQHADYVATYPSHGVFDKLQTMSKNDLAFVDLVRALLHPDPSFRLGSDSMGRMSATVSEHEYFDSIDMTALRARRLPAPESVLEAIGQSRVLETLQHASTPQVPQRHPRATRMPPRKARTAPAAAAVTLAWESSF